MYKVSAGVVWTPFDDVAICVCLCVLGLGLHVGRLEIAKRTRIRGAKTVLFNSSSNSKAVLNVRQE